MDLDEVADELYGAEPGDFVARRDERAAALRRDGQRELAAAVKALRRPTAAASVVNRLARARPEDVSRLVELGAQMREAQASLAGDELRALSRQRQQLVVALGREAARLAREAGHPFSDAVEREVEATLDAALADPAAGAAVQSGRLLRSLEHRGLEVDLDGAVGGGPAVSGRAPSRGGPASSRGGPLSSRGGPRSGPPGGSARQGAADREEGDRDEADREEAGRREAELRAAIDAAMAEEREARDRMQRHEAESAEVAGAVRPAEKEAAAARRRVEQLESELDRARRQAERAEAALEQSRRLRQEADDRAAAARREHEAAAERLRALQREGGRGRPT